MRQETTKRTNRTEHALAAFVAALVLALSVAAPAQSQNGGGSVNNAAPVVDADGTYAECGSAAFGDQDGSVSPTLTFNDGVAGNTYDEDGTASAVLKWGEWAANPGATAVASGSGANLEGRYIKAASSASAATVELFTFEVFDPNGEEDITFVRLDSTDPTLDDLGDGPAGSGYAPTAGDRGQTALPGSGPGVDADGFAVWNPTASDGRLCVRLRYTWPAGQTTGTYTQQAFGKDEDPEVGAPSPGDDDTSTFATTATATLDFTDPSFGGQTDAAFAVDLDGRIDFHWVVEPTATAGDPSALTFDESSVDDADGAVAITLAADETTWVYYVIDIVDTAGASVLKDQTYASAFTWA